KWNAAPSECRADNSVITHVVSGRTVTFADVAAAAGNVEPPPNIKLKDRRDWRLLGTPQKRLDVLAKVQGKTTYGIDVRVPDMVYAAVLQAPVFKAKLKAV